MVGTGGRDILPQPVQPMNSKYAACRKCVRRYGSTQLCNWLRGSTVAFKSLHKKPVACLQVGGLQMHGTGTPLGDPIEIGAAAAVLQVL